MYYGQLCAVRYESCTWCSRIQRTLSLWIRFQPVEEDHNEVHQTWAMFQLRFTSKPFNLAVSCSWCMNHLLSESVPPLLKTMYLGQSVLAVLWEAEGRHPKARALWGVHKHNQCGFWQRCSAVAYLNELKMRRKLGQCSDFDHPSQSPLSRARGIWCWLDKGKWDRYTWNKREGPVGLRDSLLGWRCV